MKKISFLICAFLFSFFNVCYKYIFVKNSINVFNRNSSVIGFSVVSSNTSVPYFRIFIYSFLFLILVFGIFIFILKKKNYFFYLNEININILNIFLLISIGMAFFNINISIVCLLIGSIIFFYKYLFHKKIFIFSLIIYIFSIIGFYFISY